LRRSRVRRGVGLSTGLCSLLRDRRRSSPPRLRHPRTHGWRRRRRTGDSSLDRCLLQRHRDQRAGWLRTPDLGRNDYNGEIGCLDSSILPGKTETGKPKSLAAEGQTQQQRVEQQRDQQRIRQSPVPGAHALSVGAALEPVKLKRASPSLVARRGRRGAGRLLRAGKAERTHCHAVAQSPRWSKKIAEGSGRAHQSETVPGPAFRRNDRLRGACTRSPSSRSGNRT